MTYSEKPEKYASLEWLLRNGANPNLEVSQTGWTALHSAAKKNNLPTISKQTLFY